MNTVAGLLVFFSSEAVWSRAEQRQLALEGLFLTKSCL